MFPTRRMFLRANPKFLGHAPSYPGVVGDASSPGVGDAIGTGISNGIAASVSALAVGALVGGLVAGAVVGMGAFALTSSDGKPHYGEGALVGAMGGIAIPLTIGLLSALTQVRFKTTPASLGEGDEGAKQAFSNLSFGDKASAVLGGTLSLSPGVWVLSIGAGALVGTVLAAVVTSKDTSPHYAVGAILGAGVGVVGASLVEMI